MVGDLVAWVCCLDKFLLVDSFVDPDFDMPVVAFVVVAALTVGMMIGILQARVLSRVVAMYPSMGFGVGCVDFHCGSQIDGDPSMMSLWSSRDVVLVGDLVFCHIFVLMVNEIDTYLVVDEIEFDHGIGLGDFLVSLRVPRFDLVSV